MSINLDFSSIPSREPLAEGVYTFEVKKVEEKTSSSGNPMLLILFEEIETKTAVFENYVLTANSLWKLQELLNALGMDTSAEVSFEPEDLVGQVVKGKVVQEEYDGNIRNRMKKIYAA